LDTAEYLKLLIALVAIVDIPGGIPFFLTQTGRLEPRGRNVAAVVAAVATCVVLLVFASFGQSILSTFGITIASFKVLGGLVVLIIALDMLGLLREKEARSDADTSHHGPVAVGIFPLAVPFFAGPGAITTVMVYANEDIHVGAQFHFLIVVAVILSACSVLFVALMLASRLSGLIGPVTQVVMNRLLGMIVGALGVEFILEGLTEHFPVFSVT
jgi:MarC family membrane protein